MAVTMGHPIAAIATGHGRSGIGILRMSGEGCIERAAKVFSRADGKPLGGSICTADDFDVDEEYDDEDDFLS